MDILETTVHGNTEGRWSLWKTADALSKRSNVDDAKELTGWKKVSHFVYRSELFFLPSQTFFFFCAGDGVACKRVR